MSQEILLIGLDPIGSAIGLALGVNKQKMVRSGFDFDSARAKAARKSGAVDRIAGDLGKALQSAGLVVLNLPPQELNTALAEIDPSSLQGVVVLDASPAKEAAQEWAAARLPAGCYYIGITPIIGPAAFLRFQGTEIEPNATLFKGGLIGVTIPPATPESAIELALTFVELLGAAPLFIEPNEIDAALSAVEGLPRLLGAALIKSVAGDSNWQDARRFAGLPLAAAIQAGGEAQPKELAATLIHWRAHLAPRLEKLIELLSQLQTLLEKEDLDKLGALLGEALKEQRSWLADRSEVASEAEKPKRRPAFILPGF